MALVGEVRRRFAGPIALSGAIATGDAILAAQAMGADFAYIGTRFIASEEANASAEYKQALLKAGASDIIYSNLFSGVHGNYVRESIERHLTTQGWHVIHEAPTREQRLAHDRLVRLQWDEGYPALRTPLDLPAAGALARVIEEATGQKPLQAPTLGGSLPLHLFEDVLPAPFLVLPVVNHDNRQHGPDENLRVQNLWDGIAILAQVLARMGSSTW